MKDNTNDSKSKIIAFKTFKKKSDLKEIVKEEKLSTENNSAKKIKEYELVDSVFFDDEKIKFFQVDRFFLEHGCFGLSTKTKFIQKVIQQNKEYIEITCSNLYGYANQFDKDVLTFCTTKLNDHKLKTNQITNKVVFKINSYLKAMGLPVNGTYYKRVEESLDRLAGTRIKRTTTLKDNKTRKINDGLINRWAWYERESAIVEVTLSTTIVEAIANGELLNISPLYFNIKSPLLRRLYELAKKHCGNNEYWDFKVTTIYERSASNIDFKYFKRDLFQLLRDEKRMQTLPEYQILIIDNGEKIRFLNATGKKNLEKITLQEFENNPKYRGNNAFDSAVLVFEDGKDLSIEIQDKYNIKDDVYFKARKLGFKNKKSKEKNQKKKTICTNKSIDNKKIDDENLALLLDIALSEKRFGGVLHSTIESLKGYGLSDEDLKKYGL